MSKCFVCKQLIMKNPSWEYNLSTDHEEEDCPILKSVGEKIRSKKISQCNLCGGFHILEDCPIEYIAKLFIKIKSLQKPKKNRCPICQKEQFRCTCYSFPKS